MPIASGSVEPVLGGHLLQRQIRLPFSLYLNESECAVERCDDGHAMRAAKLAEGPLQLGLAQVGLGLRVELGKI